MNTDMLLQDLKRDEGMVLHAYQDLEGFWTIGIGRLIDARKGGGISETEALVLAKDDIFKVIGQLDNRLTWWRTLSEPRQRALANLAFNLGIDGLLGFKHALAALQDGNYERAADEFLDSKWASQVKGRSQRIADMIRKG